ncbi:MAG: hypothetical protein QOD92_1528 [Acidimicrobiaceae bacterium]|jgi:hypothetical protein
MNAVIALISWDPEIRNILSLGVGIAILVGSVVLLLSTNTGPRTGILIGLASLLGWMTIMGLIWWMYSGSPASLGGMKGMPPHWRIVDVNVGDLHASPLPVAAALPTLDETKMVQDILAKHPELEAKVNPEHKPDKVTTIGELVEADPALTEEFKLSPADLAGWHLLVPSNAQRGDAQAVADAELGPTGKKMFTDPSQYKVLEAYDIGGKENDFPVPEHAVCTGANPFQGDGPQPFNTGCWHRVANWFATTFHTNPEHFAIVQVQAVIPQETPPGGTPPTPQIDPKAPIITVVMIRSLGDVRFPGFMLFTVGGILFAITCNTLHRRDKRMAAARAAAP